MTQNTQHIGDIHSTARGSGARFNGGKPAMELIPLDLIGIYYLTRNQPLGEALVYLGQFQRSGAALILYKIIDQLGPATAWQECAQVFDYGREKYGAWNWAKGMAWSVPIACAARHLIAMIQGEDTDPESGLSHRGHVMCNLVMLLTYNQCYREGDDRPKDMEAGDDGSRGNALQAASE